MTSKVLLGEAVGCATVCVVSVRGVGETRTVINLYYRRLKASYDIHFAVSYLILSYSFLFNALMYVLQDEKNIVQPLSWVL